MKNVLIVMGSDSDLGQVMPAWQILEALGIGFEVTIASAHRSPSRLAIIASEARERGFGVILAGAGGAAHLAGVIAAHTTLPVIAVPIVVGTLGGIDSLLSSVQMPGGIPLVSVGIGGAKNAGLFAAEILGSTDSNVAERLRLFREHQEARVVEADRRVKEKLSSEGVQGVQNGSI